MGHQIIPQPDGLYAIFSSVVDSWIVYDATRQDIIDYYVELAGKDARRDTERILDRVDGNPSRAYYQFTMTFEEANAKSVEHGGEDLSGKTGEAAMTIDNTAADASLISLAERVKRYLGHIEDMSDDERVLLLGAFADAVDRVQHRVRELYAAAADGYYADAADGYLAALPPLHEVMLALGDEDGP